MLYILTLNYNGTDKLNSLYNSIISNVCDIDFKWFVKDNGSSDSSLNLIKGWNNKNIIPIDYKHNRDNFAEGCNFLFKEASPNNKDLILLLNNDIIFNGDSSIKNMIKIIDNDDKVGVVGARLLYNNTDNLQHAGVIFSNRTNKLPFHFRPGEKTDENALKDREFQAITGACLLTRAADYSQIGGLDIKFRWSFEDISYCLSVKYDLKKKIVYCGSTNIFHEESATLKKNPVNKLFMGHNVHHFIDKWKNKYIIDHDLYLDNPNYNVYY